VNPDGILSADEGAKFRSLLNTYDDVFNPELSHYNGKSGACFVEVNMGSTPPPQHKGRIPFYGRDNMVELQEKFDELTAKGVFRRPQDIGVSVEIVNPSFLVKKQPPSTDKRLVTDFCQITDYCRTTPTRMPDVDSTMCKMKPVEFLYKNIFQENNIKLTCCCL